MKTFNCDQCNQIVYFDNVVCESCGSSLGFRPDSLVMAAFEIAADGTWRQVGSDDGQAWRPCHNYSVENVCNWVIDATEYNQNTLCRSCRTTQIIPALTNPNNKRYWYLLEKAKRHLFYTLLDFGLPIPDRSWDPQRGLSFEFLEDETPHRKVVTGHDNGVITVNIAEADDVTRASIRSAMGEPYRTLLGHFRHESGHFYWDYLIGGSPWQQSFRAAFGDESYDYAAAMQRYYDFGPQTNWSQTFISAYASAHPWEDWAESWAHYLHICDALDTAGYSGFSIVSGPTVSHGAPVRYGNLDTTDFHRILYDRWLPLVQFLNSMNRSLGQEDSYPFLINQSVVDKLAFIDRFVKAHRRQPDPAG
jgi:hypothetical protein